MSTPTLHDRFVHITVAQRAQLRALIGTPQTPELTKLVADLGEETFTDSNLDIHYRRAAADQWHCDGEIEIDENAVVSVVLDSAA